MTVAWTGPLAPLIEALAAELAYTYTVTGTPPAQPIIVAIHRTDTEVWRITRDAVAAVRVLNMDDWGNYRIEGRGKMGADQGLTQTL